MADRVLEIAALSNRTFSSFLSGQCLEAVILGTMFAVSMAIFRMPYALLVGVLIALTALIPIVGAFIGCGVGALLILLVNPIQALLFIVLFLVLQQVAVSYTHLDVYKRQVVGCVRRDWGGALETLFASFEGSVDSQLYEQLTWLGLESAVFDRERDRRPAIPALRRGYARRALAEYERFPSDRPIHVLSAGRCREILGQDAALDVYKRQGSHCPAMPPTSLRP